MICLFRIPIHVSLIGHYLKHSNPSPPIPMKLCIATLYTRSITICYPFIITDSLLTLSNGCLLESHSNAKPESAEYLPAKLGYIDTQFYKALMIRDPGTCFTTTWSSITLSMTPKVIGPSLISQSILKLPEFIKAQSAEVKCL